MRNLSLAFVVMMLAGTIVRAETCKNATQPDHQKAVDSMPAGEWNANLYFQYLAEKDTLSLTQVANILRGLRAVRGAAPLYRAPSMTRAEVTQRIFAALAERFDKETIEEFRLYVLPTIHTGD
jgi:hypothetical protein